MRSLNQNNQALSIMLAQSKASQAILKPSSKCQIKRSNSQNVPD